MDISDINLEELPEVYQMLAELVGVESMLIIAEAFGGGESIYFPKMEAIHRTARNKQIIEEFDGYNFKTLAQKYGLTEMAIRAIVRDYIQLERQKPAEGQITFW